MNWHEKRIREEIRFWHQVNKTPKCWLWTAGRSDRGYGVARLGGRAYRAHQVAYVLTHGSVPKNKELDHLCRNKLCVNPKHLEREHSAEYLAANREKICTYNREYYAINREKLLVQMRWRRARC